jgi:hypothetical protein
MWNDRWKSVTRINGDKISRDFSKLDDSGATQARAPGRYFLDAFEFQTYGQLSATGVALVVISGRPHQLVSEIINTCRETPC